MRRTRTIAVGVLAALAAAVLASGAAYGVLNFTATEESTPQATPATSPSPSPTPSETRTPSPTPSKTKTANPPVLEPGDSGKKVRELQARLKQLHWYSPDVTAKYDKTTKSAVMGFQEKRGFKANGVVNRQTWRRVVKMSREPTDDELHNRAGPAILSSGDSGKKVRELQARLKQIGWFDDKVTDHYGDVTRTAVAGFQTKRAIPSTGEVDRRTMDKLLAMTREPTKDELHNRTEEKSEDESESKAPLDPRCKTGRVLCIDKSSNSLRWVIDGEVQTSVDVRFGSDEMPTREGQFSVNFKSRDHVSSIYDTPMPYAMFFSGGQAVHYSPDFAARGYNGASHGCINVRDRAAVKSLFSQVDVGDKVIVYWS